MPGLSVSLCQDCCKSDKGPWHCCGNAVIQTKPCLNTMSCLWTKQAAANNFSIYTQDTGTISNSVNNMKCQLGRAEALREFSSSKKLIIQQSDIQSVLNFLNWTLNRKNATVVITSVVTKGKIQVLIPLAPSPAWYFSMAWLPFGHIPSSFLWWSLKFI